MGSVLDLSAPTLRVVGPVALDAHVVVARVLASYPGPDHRSPPVRYGGPGTPCRRSR